MKEIDELRKQYYKAIEYLQDKDDIIEALPKPEYTNFFPIVYGLVEKLSIEITSAKAMFNEESDNEMKEYIFDEIKTFKFKLDTCNSLIKEAKEKEKVETEVREPEKKALIFATTNLGNVYFERDLKEIPEEYYSDVSECLKLIENNYKEENTEHAKALGVDNNLVGIHEMKKFKLRVFYKFLTPDSAYIMGVSMKKSDNSTKYKSFAATRNDHTKKEYVRLKEELKDELKKMQIIEINDKIKDKIISDINLNKRGVKSE